MDLAMPHRDTANSQMHHCDKLHRSDGRSTRQWSGKRPRSERLTMRERLPTSRGSPSDIFHFPYNRDGRTRLNRVQWSRGRPGQRFPLPVRLRREIGSNRVPGSGGSLIEPVSADSLPKMGIFAETAGDFCRFPPPPRPPGSSETKANARKARISGPFSRLLGSLAKRRNAWLATQC